MKPNTELSKDVIFDLLSVERRRHVIRIIDEEDEILIGNVAEHIAAIENHVKLQEINSEQRKRVYVSLYQMHLPKLAEYDVIEYDQNRGVIKEEQNLKHLLPYILTPPIE